MRGLLEEGSDVDGLAQDEASEHRRCRTGSRKVPRDHPPAGALCTSRSGHIRAGLRKLKVEKHA